MLPIEFLFNTNKYLSSYGNDWLVEDSQTHDIHELDGKLLPNLEKRSNSYEENAYKIIGWSWMVHHNAWAPIVKPVNATNGFRQFLNLKSNKIEIASQYGINYILHQNYSDINKFKANIFSKWPDAKLSENLFHIRNETTDIKKSDYICSIDIAESQKIVNKSDYILGLTKEYVDNQSASYSSHPDNFYLEKFEKLSSEQKANFITKFRGKFIGFNSDAELKNIINLLAEVEFKSRSKSSFISDLKNTIYVYEGSNSYSIVKKTITLPNNYTTLIKSLKQYIDATLPALKIVNSSTYGIFDAKKSFSLNIDFLYSNTEAEIESDILRSHPKVVDHKFDKTIGLSYDYLLI